MHTVILEYIWLDGHGELRSKYKTVYVEDPYHFELEKWNYDGSSTYQAETGNSEIILRFSKLQHCLKRSTHQALPTKIGIPENYVVDIPVITFEADAHTTYRLSIKLYNK